MQLSKNFTQKEFIESRFFKGYQNKVNDSFKKNEDILLPNLIKLAEQLQIIRDYTGKSITINSGYRSPEHNASIGGVSNSQHVLGKAADIVIDGMSPADTYALIEYLNDKGVIKIGGLGSYNIFTHVDIREKTARW